MIFETGIPDSRNGTEFLPKNSWKEKWTMWAKNKLIKSFEFLTKASCSQEAQTRRGTCTHDSRAGSAEVRPDDWLRVHGVCYLGVRQQRSVRRAAGKESGSQALIGLGRFLKPAWFLQLEHTLATTHSARRKLSPLLRAARGQSSDSWSVCKKEGC